MFKKLILVYLCIGFSIAIAQKKDVDDPCEGAVNDKKVKAFFDKSQDKKKYEYKERYKFLKDAVAMDEDCAVCIWELAKMSLNTAQVNGTSFEIPRKYHMMVEKQCPLYHADVYYNLAVMAYSEEDDKTAYYYFNKFLDFPTKDDSKLSKNYAKQIKDVQEIMPTVEFYVQFYHNPVPYNPFVVPNVSSPLDEYLPMISPDNELMFFTRKYEYKNKGDILSTIEEKLMLSRREDINGKFDAGEPMPFPFDKAPNLGGVSISLDNKEMFVCKCEKVADYNNCDLYVTRYKKLEKNGKEYYGWSELENLGPNVNGPRSWEAQPSIGADGKTLFFATNRPGSKGMDIYYTERQSDGSWGVAKSIGSTINTAAHEKAPFIHSDSRTLYFAAETNDKRLGAGGYDIFYTKQDPTTGEWSKPRNLGYPINNEGDQEGLIVSTDGKLAYFSSSGHKGAVGGKDILAFEVPEKARPDKVKLIKGDVRTKDKEPISNAKLELRYEDGKVLEQDLKTDDDGKYVAMVNMGKGDEDVLMIVKKEGYAFESILLKKEEVNEPVVKNTELNINKIETGQAFTINDILFATKSYDLNANSKMVLNGFVSFLKGNSKITIEIQGHTDDIGNENDNLILSEKRAESVMNYLITQGIDKKRLKSKGYGESKPKVPNDSDKNRAKNRRTDFIILTK